MTDLHRERLAGYGYMTAATLTWGSLPVIIALADASAVVLVGLRMGFGAAALGAFLVVFGRKDILPHTHRRLVAVLGVVLALHWVLFFRAIQLIGALGVIISFVFPLLVALAAPRVLGEDRQSHTVPLAVVGLAGTGLILASDSSSANLAGGLIALATSVLAAGLVLGARRAVEAVPGPVIAFWQQAIGVTVLLPWILTVDAGSSIPWAWGAFMGVVHTAAAGVLFFRSIGRVPAQEAGILMYVEPASAVGFVWVFHGEVPTPLDGLGGALVIGAGVALVVLSGRRVRRRRTV